MTLPSVGADTVGATPKKVEAAVPAATSAPRHLAVVRVTHWITALGFFALLVSGIEIVIAHPRFYWGEVGNVMTPPLFALPIPASRRLQAAGFADWRLTIDGMVDRPASLSLADLRSYPAGSQITMLTCEEGWSFIAEWIGVPLFEVLHAVGIHPQARYVTYVSMQPKWRQNIDMADALHPQTLLTYGMNGGGLPIGHGGPLRMRVPRQLGYKNLKFINRLTVTDNLKDLLPNGNYPWYAGI